MLNKVTDILFNTVPTSKFVIIFLASTVVNSTLTPSLTLVFKFQLLPRSEWFQLTIPLEAFTSTRCIKAVIERLKNVTFPIILCHSYIYFLSCLSNSCVCLRVLGTIAEREHRKWESAPPLPNNPYSPENINKRLSRQSTGFSSRSSSVASM